MPTYKLTEKSFETLAKVLRCWLDFQIHCGRDPLLSEAYLTQPLGEYFLTHYSGYLEREHSHPQFTQAKKGRPKQVDFMLNTRDQKFVEFAVECKWAGHAQPSRQPIVDDVMRLECLRRPNDNGTNKRFFVLAGKKTAISSFLIGRVNKTGQNPAPNFAEGFLPLNVSSKLEKFEVLACEKYYRRYYSDFSKAYKVDLPRSYRCKLVADEIGDEVRVLIWQIASSKHRTVFNRKTEWSSKP